MTGTKFTDAIPDVLDKSFETTVAASSLVLEESRASLDQQQRLKSLAEDDSLLRERLAILNDLKKHARVLRNYFVALQTLAQTDAKSSGIMDVADGLVTSVSDLSPRIRDATIGGESVKSLTPPAVNFAFVSFQSSLLDKELRRNAPTIERELALQQGALAAIADAMRSDLEAEETAKDRDRIQLPYIRDDPLPADWEQRRLESFRWQAEMSSIDAAAQAAESLRSSFVALVENRLDHAAISTLIHDVNDVVSFVDKAAATSPGEVD